MHLQAKLDDNVDDDPNHQNPGSPPWDVSLAKVHANEDVGN